MPWIEDTSGMDIISIVQKIKMKEDHHLSRYAEMTMAPPFWFLGYKTEKTTPNANHPMLSLVECRKSCKREGGIAAAPTNETGVRLMRRLRPNVDTLWTAHIDREWAMSESRYVNPITGETIAATYQKCDVLQGQWIGPKGEHLKPLPTHIPRWELDDDFNSALYLVANPDVLWYKLAEGMQNSLGHNTRGKLTDTSDRYRANCICQRLPDESIHDTFVPSPTEPVSRLLTQVLIEGADHLDKMADQHQLQINEVEQAYNIYRPWTLEPKTPPTGTNADRFKRNFLSDIGDIINSAVNDFVPVLGGVVSVVEKLIQGSEMSPLEKARHVSDLRPEDTELIKKAYSMAKDNAHDMGTMEIEQGQLKESLRDVAHQIADCTSSLTLTSSKVEVMSVQMAISTAASRQDLLFQSGLSKFKMALKEASDKHSPQTVYTHKVMEDLRRYLALNYGLTVQEYLQDAVATIIPGSKPNHLTVLSSLKATASPWALMKQTAVPHWIGGHLWQAQLPTTYFAIDQDYKYYVPLNEVQAHACKNRVCSFRGPHRPLARQKCGPSLITAGGELASCSIKMLPAEDFFSLTENGLIFAVQGRTKLTLQCEFRADKHFPDTFVVEQSGIVQMAPGCQITTPTGDVYKGPVYSRMKIDETINIKKLGGTEHETLMASLVSRDERDNAADDLN